MALNTIELDCDFTDLTESAAGGTVSLVPTGVIADSAGTIVVGQVPVTRNIAEDGTVSFPEIIACDNTDLTPTYGLWAYNLTVALTDAPPYTVTYLLTYANGATQDLSAQTPVTPVTAYIAPSEGAGMGGTVTSVAVESANGFAGTVADDTTDAAITIETSITGILKGTGTAIEAATAGTDYLTPTEAASDYLALAGGTMSGAIAMGSHKVTGLTDGSTSGDAAGFDQLPSSGTPLALSKGGTGVSESTAAALLAAIGAAALAGATFTGAVIPSVAALTDAATILVNAALGNVFTVTLGGDRTMGAPSNPTAGQAIQFHLTQDGTGSRTVTWASAYNFGTTGAPALTTTAGDMDIVAFVYDGGLSKWCCLGSGLGF